MKTWFKSSHSGGGNGCCVEIKFTQVKEKTE